MSGFWYADSFTKKLAEKNYINRQRETGDERIVNVTLTPQGAALQKQAEGIPQRSSLIFHLNRKNWIHCNI